MHAFWSGQFTTLFLNVESLEYYTRAVRMVSTRRRGRGNAEADAEEDAQPVNIREAEENIGNSSDDEAPEEVTLSRGKKVR